MRGSVSCPARISVCTAPGLSTTTTRHVGGGGSACVCAEAVGVMDKTLAITAEYMNTRKQFGVPIASFQALRHRLACQQHQQDQAAQQVQGHDGGKQFHGDGQGTECTLQHHPQQGQRGQPFGRLMQRIA